jgi:hypothetical protein
VPTMIDLPTFSDPRGNLTVLENLLPFEIKRVFFLHEIKDVRGGHGHIDCKLALIALSGWVEIFCQTPANDCRYVLDSPSKCLLLDPIDWHLIDKFSENVTLLALASHTYNKNDYFFEKYR